jgi:hypothetical protein
LESFLTALAEHDVTASTLNQAFDRKTFNAQHSTFKTEFSSAESPLQFGR